MQKSPFYIAWLLIGLFATSCNRPIEKESRWCDALPRHVNDSLKTGYSNYWFEVYKVQDSIFAIYEPYQWQEVISYLVIGKDFALLFDTGNGIGNIKEIVESITPLPIRVLNSHSHIDHVGGNADFDFIYGMDTEFTRGRKTGRSHDRVADEVSPAALCKSLPEGVKAEDHHIRAYEIDEFVSEGYVIDMGNRKLEVISIPGHTPDAIGLLDEQRGLLWTGDTFYKGPIWLFAQETDLQAYKNSISRLAALSRSLRLVLPAHNTPLAEPHLLVDLDDALHAIEEGKVDGTINKDGRKVYSFRDFSILMAPEANTIKKP